jgi:hypothetical protein
LYSLISEPLWLFAISKIKNTVRARIVLMHDRAVLIDPMPNVTSTGEVLSTNAARVIRKSALVSGVL